MKYSFKKVESVDFPIVSNLILGYYQEDKTDKPITAEKIQRTLTELLSFYVVGCGVINFKRFIFSWRYQDK